MRAVIDQFEFIITAIKHATYVMHVLYGGNNARCLPHKRVVKGGTKSQFPA